MNDVEPYAYLRDALQRMVEGHPINRLDELLLWNWRSPVVTVWTESTRLSCGVVASWRGPCVTTRSAQGRHMLFFGPHSMARKRGGPSDQKSERTHPLTVTVR